jgi:hypothetical protein
LIAQARIRSQVEREITMKNKSLADASAKRLIPVVDPEQEVSYSTVPSQLVLFFELLRT